MKILFCDMDMSRVDEAKSALLGHEVSFFEGSAGEFSENLDVECLSVFVASKLPAEVLSRFPSLKVIATRSTGFDHIDLEYCKSKDISVLSVPAYGERTVAEYAFALLLSLSRKVFDGVYRVKHRGQFNSDGLTGFDLFEKTIGIIGTGKIGCHVAMIAQGFGMKILASDIRENEELVKNCGVKYVSLEELLASSDVITLHAPYLPATHHMLNAGNLAKVKKGSYLINTARGALVDSQALVICLKSGQLAGAALDVLEEEGYIGEELELLKAHPKEEELIGILATHELMTMPNVIITPHNAFNTEEALNRIWSTTYSNISSFETGQPDNLVK